MDDLAIRDMSRKDINLFIKSNISENENFYGLYLSHDYY